MAKECKRHGLPKATGKMCIGCAKEAADSAITTEAAKTIRKWASKDAYVYMRPVSSRYVDASLKPQRTYWIVNVEFRSPQPIQKRGEGYVLSDVIYEMAPEVNALLLSAKSDKPGYWPGKKTGWLAPSEVSRQEQEHAAKKTRSKKKKAKG